MRKSKSSKAWAKGSSPILVRHQMSKMRVSLLTASSGIIGFGWLDFAYFVLVNRFNVC